MNPGVAYNRSLTLVQIADADQRNVRRIDLRYAYPKSRASSSGPTPAQQASGMP